MGSHFPAPRATRPHPAPRLTRHRRAGRHTSLLSDDEPPPGSAWPDGAAGPGRLISDGTRVHIRGENGTGENGAGAWYSPSPAAPMAPAAPADPPDEPGRRHSEDTVVIGDLGLFSGPRLTSGPWPKIGVNREPPPRPWYENRGRLAVAAAGLAVVAGGHASGHQGPPMSSRKL